MSVPPRQARMEGRELLEHTHILRAGGCGTELKGRLESSVLRLGLRPLGPLGLRMGHFRRPQMLPRQLASPCWGGLSYF